MICLSYFNFMLQIFHSCFMLQSIFMYLFDLKEMFHVIYLYLYNISVFCSTILRFFVVSPCFTMIIKVTMNSIR